MKIDSAIIVLISLILTSIIFGSFMTWWFETVSQRLPVPQSFVIFAWTLVMGVCWDSIIRAYREWKK